MTIKSLPAPTLTLHMNLTAVGIYDPLSNREPSPCRPTSPVPFRRDKTCRRYAVSRLGYADAGVAYSHADTDSSMAILLSPSHRAEYILSHCRGVRKGLLQKIHISEKLNRRLSVLLTHGYNTSFSLEPEAVHNVREKMIEVEALFPELKYMIVHFSKKQDIIRMRDSLTISARLFRIIPHILRLSSFSWSHFGITDK